MSDIPAALFDDPAFRAALGAPLGLEAHFWPDVGWVYGGRRLSLQHLELAPLGLYASPTADVGRFLEEAPRRAARVALQIDPLDWRADDLVAQAARSGWRVQQRETHLLALDRPLESVRAGYHATKRLQARRAVAPRFEIECTRERAHLDPYFDLYAASLARWGRAGFLYPRALFAALLESPAVELWLNRVEGRLACALVVFVSRRFALYWQGVSRIEADQKAAFPMVKLMDALIASLHGRGVPLLNLGASDGLPNVRRFKEELGGRPAPYAALLHESALWRALAALRRAVG